MKNSIKNRNDSMHHTTFEPHPRPGHHCRSWQPEVGTGTFKNFSRLPGLVKILLLFLFPIGSMAQTPTDVPEQLNQYLVLAAQNNPHLKAQFQQYLAALEQIPQVNTLPDPEFSFGYFISPIETRVGPQQARFGLTQMFPWFGTLGDRGDAATQMAKARFEDFKESRNKLFFQVQKSWYKLYQIKKSTQILQENIDILGTFESLTTRRYETGQVGQIDVLRVQIEKEDLNTRLALQKDNLRVALQQFNELLNEPEGHGTVVADSLVSREFPMKIPELKQAVVQNNPRLGSLDLEAQSARSAIDVAHKEGLPKLGLGIDYIITDKRTDMALTDNGRDAIMARGSIQIPLYRRKYRAKERQAKFELRSIQNRQVMVKNHLQTELEQALRDYYDARRRIDLYKNIQISRTRQALNILSDQYATSDADFEELLRLQRKLLEYELARETAIADQNTAVAYLNYLAGTYNIDSENISK